MHVGSSSTPPLRGVFDRASSPFNRVRRETRPDGHDALVCEYFADAYSWIRTTRRIEEMATLRTDTRTA